MKAIFFLMIAICLLCGSLLGKLFKKLEDEVNENYKDIHGKDKWEQ